MGKADRKRNLLQVGRDLETLSRILGGANPPLCNDPSPLVRAANYCRTAVTHDEWAYDLSLLFNVFPGRHPLPAHLKLVTVEMSMRIGGPTRGFETSEALSDPLTDLAFELCIFSQPTQGARYHCAWHLDRHLGSAEPGPEDGAWNADGEPDDVHPRYHFHFGGDKMRQGFYGEMMILESPRLAHPPLDAVLGVDFVLANFRGTDRRKLVSTDRLYQEILHRSQERFWRPYIRSLSTWWDDIKSDTWSPRDVWPSLVSCSLPASLAGVQR